MLTGKTIGELPLLIGVNDEVLVPVESSGNTYHINFASVIHRPYAGYSNFTNQYVDGGNIPTVVTFDSIDIEQSISLIDNSKVTILIPGVYEFGVSYQVDMDISQANAVFFWVRLDGVDVPGTMGEIVLLNNNSEALPYIPYVFDLVEGQYFELVFASVEETVHLKFIDSITDPYARPSAPSVTLAVKQIG
jgi:hypothetical protein